MKQQENSDSWPKQAASNRPISKKIFRRFQAINPEPKGELNAVKHFTLLVAVVLSAQATDEGVNRATRTAIRDRRYT